MFVFIGKSFGPHQLALLKGHQECVFLLTKAGADISLDISRDGRKGARSALNSPQLADSMSAADPSHTNKKANVVDETAPEPSSNGSEGDVSRPILSAKGLEAAVTDITNEKEDPKKGGPKGDSPVIQQGTTPSKSSSASGAATGSDDEEQPIDNDNDYSIYDKYGFLKKGKSPALSAKSKDKEAKRALKWSKLIANWQQVKKKKDSRFQSRVLKGIPDCVRGTAWKLFTNADEIKQSPTEYQELCGKGQDIADAKQIDLDIKRTYRNHFMFRDKKGIGQKALSNILKAYAYFDPEVGYCQGMSGITAILLMYMEEEEAWWTLVALQSTEPYSMAGLYKPGFPRLLSCFDLHEALLKMVMPNIHSHFGKEGIITSMYATKWYINVFLEALPFPVVVRVWDLYMWGGYEVVFNISLAILKMYEDQLLKMKFERILTFFTDTLPKESLDADELFSVYKKIRAKTKNQIHV